MVAVHGVALDYFRMIARFYHVFRDSHSEKMLSHKGQISTSININPTQKRTKVSVLHKRFCTCLQKLKMHSNVTSFVASVCNGVVKTRNALKEKFRGEPRG